MLFSIKDPTKVVPVPKQEAILGLYSAQQRAPQQRYRFNSQEEALAAIKAGKIRMSDEVEYPGSNAPTVKQADHDDFWDEFPHTAPDVKDKWDQFRATLGMGPNYKPQPKKEYHCKKCGAKSKWTTEGEDTNLEEHYLDCPKCGKTEAA